MLHENITIPLCFGMQSLVGVNTDAPYPLSFGNYFSLIKPFEPTEDKLEFLKYEIRVVNMWAENLKEASKLFLTDNQITLRTYINQRIALVDDPRIPKEWLYPKLCFTGIGLRDVDVARDMYEYIGDPNNELERFTDPHSYYDKRGMTYENGAIRYKSPEKTNEQ